MLRIRLLAVLMLLLTACGGGGGGSTPVVASTCSNGATDFPTCTPPGTGTASTLVSIQFGSNGRIDAVAGSASITVPLTLSEATTGLSARLISGPSFATLEGFNLKIDLSALPQVPATYPLVVAVTDQSNVERGRQTGSVEVSAVIAVSQSRELANGATVSIDAVGMTVSAPANAFQSGSAQIQMQRTVDAQGEASLELVLSEPNVVPLALNPTATSTLGSASRALVVGGRALASSAVTNASNLGSMRVE